MEKLILENQGLIGQVIKDLHCRFTTYDDYLEIYDAGMLGLIYGAKSYDGSVKPSTYLYKCIKNEILKLFGTRTRLKEIPISKIYSLDYEYEEGTLAEIIATDVNLEEDLIHKETAKEVREVISRLKPYHQQILKLHFGIGTKSHTLRELAGIYHCSHQNIYRIYSIAKKHFITEWRKYENHRCKK